MIRSLLTGGLLALAFTGFAKEINTDHTYGLGDASSPPATIDAARMLIGGWAGKGFGQQFEETWNAPSAGTMVGMFKVFSDQDGVSFYELMIIEEVEDSLVLKVKHFNSDFSGWEEKDDFVAMPLVEASENELHFNGLSFYRINDNRIDTYVAIKGENGAREEKLIYSRVSMP
jgi:hypothetical protein